MAATTAAIFLSAEELKHMKSNVYLVVTSAFMLAGDMVTEGQIVEVTNAEARDLLERGKARVATAEDGVPAVAEPTEAEGDDAADGDDAKPAKRGARK